MKDEREEQRRFERQLARKNERLRRFRTEGDRGIWFGLGMFGLVGWSIAVPVLLGTAIGVWLDGRFGGGIRWTLSLMVGGLVFGGMNVWNWLERQREDE